jgi:hypothetical protein
MNRATKLLVAVWACAAIATDIWLVPSLWPGFKTDAVVAFVLAAALTAINRRSIGLILILAYVYPVLIFLNGGWYHVDFDIIWLAALAGAIMPDALRTGWRVPPIWRAPLVLWALVGVIGATIVLTREMDFYLPLLRETHVGNSVTGGGGPAFLSLGLFDVSLSLIVGILWFDWLFGAGLDFHRDVATPLMLSLLALAAVAVYQLFVDFTFLNHNVFGGMGRASGTMFDANASGAIAAFWTGGAIVWANGLRRWRAPAAVVGALAAWLAVWASGSRGAFLSATIATAFALYALSGGLWRRLSGMRPWQLAGGAAVVVTMVWLLAHSQPQIIGPVTRVRETLPGPTIASIRGFAWEAWDRNRYGSIAASGIEQFPLFGVGISSFHMMVNDFVGKGQDPLIPDNAQNWYRHQLAELGVVGSVGWIAWVLTFGWFVLKPPPRAPVLALAVRGTLIGFAFVSLFGVPAQPLAVSFTFWTAAFWYVSLAGAPPRAPLSREMWGGILAVALLFGVGTLAFARTTLRVPARAQRVGFPYSYGFYYPEPDGEGGEYRWTKQRASMVVAAPAHVVALSVWVNHRDVETNPVDVKAWCDGVLVLNTKLTHTSPVTIFVELPAAESRMIVDTWVNRVVRPRDFGVDDSRELGLMVRWSFLDRVPDGLAAVRVP